RQIFVELVWALLPCQILSFEMIRVSLRFYDNSLLVYHTHITNGREPVGRNIRHKVCYKKRLPLRQTTAMSHSMDISVKALEEAVSIRRQIDNLQRRLSSILGSAPARPTAPREAGRYFSPSTRAKLSAAARARWARLRGGATKPTAPRKKGALTPAGRKKLSELMKARWAARRKGAATKKAPGAKKGGLTAAGRRRLSQLMKARWAARRKAAGRK